MQGQELRWLNCIERTDKRLRVSHELSAKSIQSLSKSRDLVLQSKTLLAQEQQSLQVTPSETQSAATPPKAERETLPTRAPVSPANRAPHLRQGLELVCDRSIEGEVVSMDGKHFVDCEFLNCTLQYSGQPVILESTRFEHCGFQFSGEAAMTARFLECFQILPEDTVEYASSRPVSGSLRPN